MHKIGIKTATLCVVVASCLFARATFARGEAEFAQPLLVSRQGNVHIIEFAGSIETDCAVSILNAQGRVVRHLAAGLLGKNAPAPLTAGSLQQSLRWDGNDDRGRPAQGGPFQVSVGLGTKPVLHEMLGNNPAALGSVRALAVGPTGELFVFHVFGELHPSDGTPSCAVFDRDGKYLRTILPFPAGLPDDAWHELKRIVRDDGTKVPLLVQAETRSYLPGAGDLTPHRAVATRDGRILFAGIQEGPKRYAQAGQSKVLVISASGGVPKSGLAGPVLAELSSAAASLALSPDERTIYAVGQSEGNSRGKPTHAVLRAAWSDERATTFIGSPAEAGSGSNRLNTPRSVAVDSDGNIYVADRGNNRIAVFAATGGFMGELPVAAPERVEVHARTGALYVLSGARVDRLQKFVSWKQSQPSAEVELPFFKHVNYTALLALDQASEPPVLWVSNHMARYAQYDLLRIEDQGSKFGPPRDVGRSQAAAAPFAGPVMDLELDRRQDRLIVNAQLYDLKTKEWSEGLKEASGKSTNNLGVGSLGLDGNFYTQIFPNFIRRIGPDLKPIPFTGARTTKKGDLLSPLKKGDMRVRGRGITADYDGNMYILWEDQEHFDRGEAFNQLYRHAPDGSVTKERLIDGGIRSLNSVRVDPAGNIYLALGLRPGAELLPPTLHGVPATPKNSSFVGELNCYPLIYGSIAKFGPDGGAVRPNCGGVPCNYAFGAKVEVKGAQWIYSGASPVVSWRTPGTPDICNCESPRFDVDEFGRSFFPDAAQCRVGMLDTNGNLLGWFGQYGNADSGKEHAGVPILWPYCIAVGDQGIFVGDRLNRRVAWVRITYSAQQTRPLTQ